MSKRDKFKKADQSQPPAEETPTRSLSGFDSAIFGKIAQAEVGYDNIEPVSIFSVLPDWSQPRRAMPSIVRAAWDGDPTRLGDVFTYWVETIGGKRDDIGALIEADDDVRPEDFETRPLEHALLKLTELAASIKRDGLSNPVVVIAHSDGYWLETGERRWLAYHLLNWWYGGDEWGAIPAREVTERNVWRQAAENTARANLNAIGMARQFAVLLMDLLPDDFQPFEAFETEQDYYGQVADGNLYRIPRGTGEKLLGTMGLKNAVQLRQYRALLGVPNYLWVTADDLNWTENFIRELRARAGEDDNLLTHLVIQMAAREGYTVTGVTVSDEMTAAPSAPSPDTHTRLLARLAQQFNAIERVSWRQVSGMDGEARRRLLERLETHRRHLDQLEKWLKG